jgi:hypothetical protein
MSYSKPGNGFLPSHRGALSVHINKDRLTGPVTKPSAWLSKFYIPIPGSPGRHIPIILPIPAGLVAVLRNHLARPKSVIITLLVGTLLFVNIHLFLKKVNDRRTPGQTMITAFGEVVTGQDTVVFSKDEIRKVYEWEIWGGNHPTRRRSEHFSTIIFFLNPILIYCSTSGNRHSSRSL